MHRFYADPSLSDPEHICLSAEDAKHAHTVLRLKPGQLIELIYQSSLWEAKIISSDSHEVRVSILRSLPSAEPSLSITLFQGLPKSDKMDWIVQKATEIGVTRIVPVIMERCVAKTDPKKESRKSDRWRKIIRESCKQCGRCVVPELLEPCTLPQLKNVVPMPEINIVSWEETVGYGPCSFCQDHINLSSLGILIGPEGGIDRKEIEYLRSLGFIPITLGKRILRTETAGLAAVSAILSLYGEMDS